MGKLIRVEDALICCRGNTHQAIKDTRANFAALASEYLSSFTQQREASGVPIGQLVVMLGSVLQAVKAPTGLTANPLGLGAASFAALNQAMEWTPPELQMNAVDGNELGMISIDQGLQLFEVAAQQALARNAQRVRNCFAERALSQDSKARWVAGGFRSRRARPKVTTRIVNALKRVVSNFVRKP